MRRARWKRKNVSEGRSARVRTSCRRRMEGWHVPRGCQGRKRAGPWGTLRPGGVPGIFCSAFRCRWPLPRKGQSADIREVGRADKWLRGCLFSCRGGPVCPPVGKPLRGVVSGSGDRGAGAMRLSAPDVRLRRTRGDEGGDTTERPGASRQKAGSLRRHRFWSPPSARRATAPEHDKKAFFSLDRSRPVFFSARPKRNGGWNGQAAITAGFFTHWGDFK